MKKMLITWMFFVAVVLSGVAMVNPDDLIFDDSFDDTESFEKSWFRYGFLASGITQSNRHGKAVGGADARSEWWEVRDGVLVGRRFPEEGHPSGVKRRFEPVEGDVRLSFRFRIPENGKIGFALQGDNPVVERRFNIAGGAINRSQVIAWDNDVVVPKNSSEAAEMERAGKWNRKFFYAEVVKQKIEPDVWHDLEADLVGKQLTIRIDGVEILTYTTVTGDVAKEAFTVSADSFGKPGVVVESCFDDVRLTRLKAVLQK